MERTINDARPADGTHESTARAVDSGSADADAHERRVAAGLAAGDQQALADAFASWGGMIHAFCTSRVGADAADDLTQQVFVAAWRSRHTFDPDRGVVPGWLVGIARNLANRSFRGVREIPTDTPATETIPTTRVATGPSDGTDGTEEIADRLLLGQALERLSSDQRQTLELGYLEGLTQREVAQRLAMPLGTVKSHQRRGLQQLRHVLGGAA
ncbi:MAG TPA: RNA polymerase sigma factor [Nitriliruptoraceae bacterium]|nr:RNA polymerase sigma factor [Nitriliruptoraceae bacterium]